jgi:hypothetical protein
MANENHLKLLRQGGDIGQAIAAWNTWRLKEPSVEPDFSRADLSRRYLGGANLRKANLLGTSLLRASLSGADLAGANLSGANLYQADLVETNLWDANLSGADLRGAKLIKANLLGANLSGADLSGADLRLTTLVEANLENANLSRCTIYGASAWGLTLSKGTKQQDLVITNVNVNEAEVTVDNIEMAQFVYLLLHNEKIRDAIDTIGKKGVLLLGRFTGGRIAVLARLREELRRRDFLPIVCNFDKPETKDLTETVRLLASMSRFVIVDITKPRSVPLELQAIVPHCMVPFCPILDGTEEPEPFAMLRDLQNNHPDRVSDVFRYPSLDRLIEVLDAEIIVIAERMFADLLARKAEQMRIKDI